MCGAGPQKVGERANVFVGRFILDDLEGQFLSGLFQKVPSAHGKWAPKPKNFMVSNISVLFSKRFVFSRGGSSNIFYSRAKISLNFCSRAKINFLEPC